MDKQIKYLEQVEKGNYEALEKCMLQMCYTYLDPGFKQTDIYKEYLKIINRITNVKNETISG